MTFVSKSLASCGVRTGGFQNGLSKLVTTILLGLTTLELTMCLKKYASEPLTLVTYNEQLDSPSVPRLQITLGYKHQTMVPK